MWYKLNNNNMFFQKRIAARFFLGYTEICEGRKGIIVKKDIAKIRMEYCPC